MSVVRYRSCTRFVAVVAVLALAGASVSCGSSSWLIQPRVFNTLVEQTRDQNGLPGLAAAVLDSNKVEIAVSGIRKVGEANPIARGDLFHLGSNIKAMSATMIASLIEAGALNWNTKIGDVFPELASVIRPEYQAVSIEQLLAHRGGILPFTSAEEFASAPPLSDDPVTARAEFTAWLVQQPSPVTPGQDYLYSNAGYIIAAAMAERATATPYDVLLQQHVLSPLGITAKFDWPAAGDPNQPFGHLSVNSTWIPFDPNDPNNRFPDVGTPAGNISLSVTQYASFVQAHLRGLLGHNGLVTADSYKRLHEPIGGELPTGGRYAKGWLLGELNGVVTHLHRGSAGPFDALVAIQPSRDRAAIVFCNCSSDEEDAAIGQLLSKLLQAH